MGVAECVILIGLPGAGKTTYYQTHLAASHAHISKDLMPRGSDKAARQMTALRTALKAGRSVAVDNTNPTPAERAAIIALARECGARVRGVFLDVPVREAIARNQSRSEASRVPKVAIFTCAKRLVPPTAGEGFDVLEVVTE